MYVNTSCPTHCAASRWAEDRSSPHICIHVYMYVHIYTDVYIHVYIYQLPNPVLVSKMSVMYEFVTSYILVRDSHMPLISHICVCHSAHLYCQVKMSWRTIIRLPKNIGLFCKRASYKRRYSSNENYVFREPTNHQVKMSWRTFISSYMYTCIYIYIYIHTYTDVNIHIFSHQLLNPVRVYIYIHIQM